MFKLIKALLTYFKINLQKTILKVKVIEIKLDFIFKQLKFQFCIIPLFIMFLFA